MYLLLRASRLWADVLSALGAVLLDANGVLLGVLGTGGVGTCSLVCRLQIYPLNIRRGSTDTDICAIPSYLYIAATINTFVGARAVGGPRCESARTKCTEVCARVLLASNLNQPFDCDLSFSPALLLLLLLSLIVVVDDVVSRI